MPTRAQLVSAIQTLRGRTPKTPIRDTELADMLESWLNYFDNYGEIMPETFQSQLTDILNTYDGHIATFQENIDAVTFQKDSAVHAAQLSDAARVATDALRIAASELLNNAVLAENPLGDYNAATNSPALTAVPPAAPGIPKGSYYSITEPGLTTFAGANFLPGASLAVGGRMVKKSETQWYYQKPGDTGFAKVTAIEPKVANLEKENAKLLPVYSYPAVIKQSATNNNIMFSTGSTKEQRGWLFAKSAKIVDRLGVFIFKRSSIGAIETPVRVQALHKRGEVVTKMIDKIIPFSELAANDDFDAVAAGTIMNFEYKIDLITPVSLLPGDRMFVSINCQSGLNPVYTDENKALATGEWNNGAGLYYRAWYAGADISLSDIPALPAVEVNPMTFIFYEKVVEFNRVKQLEDRATALENGKATVTTINVVGNQKFNKAAYVVTGKGIGSDGIIFDHGSFGSIIGQPVKELTTYVFSGLAGSAGRGLRFQRANGSLISFLETASNSTPFTTPTETATISCQLWSNNTPGVADAIMLNEGSTVIPVEPYSSVNYVNKGNGLGFQADSLAAGSKMGGYPVATSKDLDPEKAKIVALQAATPVGATDFTYLAPPVVFVANNEIGGFTARKEPVLLYLQRFLREKKEIWLNTAKNFVVVARNAINSATVVQENVQFTLGGGHFQTKTVSLSRVSVNTNVLAAQVPKVGYIGDSITTNRTKNGSSLFGSGCMYGMAKEMAVKNNVDNALTGYNYLLVGKTNQGSVTTSYKGNNYSFRQFADGYGGWAASTWLRHPIRMWVYPAGGWDLLGLVTTQGRAYSASTEDKVLMTKTVYGVNAPVISANSYATLVSENVIANLGAWTGSGAQIAAVQGWIDSVATNGASNQNQYLDLAKSGTNRFSIAKYLANWKTLAPDGVTRLIPGSTAGLKVVNAIDHDVCEQTHIVICVGENDSLFHSNHVEIVNDIMELATEITTQLPACHVAVCLTGIPGPMFADRHPNYIGLFDQNHHNRKFDLMKELQTRFGNLASQVANRIYLLPTYFTGTPLSHSNVSEQIDEGSGQIITVANDDYNHPGYYANRSAGSQIYAWVAFTKTL